MSSVSNALKTATLGVPRMGSRRELKFALESYWAGKTGPAELAETARTLRVAAWRDQQASGITEIPSNDFSLYDHVLDTSVMLGAIPAGYGWTGGRIEPQTYFALARGTSGHDGHHRHVHDGDGMPALEMTKWFDTNYHYLVPELVSGQTFSPASDKPVADYREARTLGIDTRPVLLGPVTWLRLCKSRDGDDVFSHLPQIVPLYADMLGRLAREGAAWVQIDEPALVLDLGDRERAAFREAYEALAKAGGLPKLMLTTYFGGLGDNLDTALSLPVDGLHVDLVRAPRQLDALTASAPAGLSLSLGVIDGRNVWRADLGAILDRLEPAVARRGAERIVVASSCSLLHVPADVELETDLDPELKGWLSFARQKMTELSVLGRALGAGRDAVADELAAAAEAVAGRRRSPRVHNDAVARRLAAVTPAMARRSSAGDVRRAVQRARLGLPAFPTTTIGSFPQTKEVRELRAARARRVLTEPAYRGRLQQLTTQAIRWQEEIGLDVLVHGEFERNDMVQYFGERLAGFAFTQHGWVQSYGSRCVRPPILYGDVSRPGTMTVDWWRFAQSQTDRPVKGMLTGPVTILNWSFVRDDIPRSETCRQIALAIRDEVADLEAAGAKLIQIDEAAVREGLPLRRSEWDAYLGWAVEGFRLCSSGVRDETQIHTHMCYSEFNDIIEAIGAMDADVISIETSRSKMELLNAFSDYHYPNEIGPGVYDIHSPRVPSSDEMAGLLAKAIERLEPDQIWVNPDCGLKTRQWDEVRPALVNMVAAARTMRHRLPGGA